MVVSKKKSKGFSTQIDQIAARIHQDYVNLEQAYPKALAEVEHELTHLNNELKTLKTMPKTSKVNPKQQGKIANILNLLTALKVEKATLLVRYKKLKAGKQVWQKFETTWEKKLKAADKSKKSVKKAKVAHTKK